MSRSGKFDLDPSHYGRTGRLHPLWKGDQLDLNRLFSSVCAAMTVAGITVRAQVEVLWEMGFSIGGGGSGPDSSVPECPYCGCHGGGGHGGFCPNGGYLPEDWVSPR